MRIDFKNLLFPQKTAYLFWAFMAVPIFENKKNYHNSVIEQQQQQQI